MAQRQNSFEVSVKRLLLIRFICSATSKPFVHAELQTFHSTQPSQGFSVVEQRCKSPQTVKKKKKPSGWGDVAMWGCWEVWGRGVMLGNQNDGQQ